MIVCTINNDLLPYYFNVKKCTINYTIIIIIIIVIDNGYETLFAVRTYNIQTFNMYLYKSRMV